MKNDRVLYTRVLGLESGLVRLSEHNPEWLKLFAEEKFGLLRVLGSCVRDIQHVGSTAVPGLVAKPVLDIALAVDRLDMVAEMEESLRSLGYERRPEIVIPEEIFFSKVSEAGGTHHLHVLALNSGPWQDFILFREYIRAYPETADEYIALKKSLADQFSDDRASYTRGKASFIQAVLEKARHWREAGPV